MKWVRTKKASEIKLKGIKVESDYVEDCLSAIILTDSEGNSIKIQRESTYYSSVNVLIPAPPKIKKQFVVKGKIDGIEIKPQYFDHDYDATSFIVHKEELTITEEEVVVDES